MSKDKNQIDFRNKIIPVPKIQYWDDAKTQPKFKVEVHKNGSLEYLQHLNADGEKQGLRTAWFENGQKLYEMNFKNDGHHGLTIMWHKNGEKACEWNYVNSESHGIHTGWHENGEKSHEACFVNDKYDGSHIEWDKKGNKILDRHYVNGELRGEKIWDKRSNGKQHGLYTAWHSNGQKHWEINYVNGREHGSCKFFDKDGKLTTDEIWDNGNPPAEEVQPAI